MRVVSLEYVGTFCVGFVYGMQYVGMFRVDVLSTEYVGIFCEGVMSLEYVCTFCEGVFLWNVLVFLVLNVVILSV